MVVFPAATIPLETSSAATVMVATTILTETSSFAWLGKPNADRVPLVTLFARPDLFWSTDRVAARMRDADVRVVDCRFSFDEDLHAQYRSEEHTSELQSQSN